MGDFAITRATLLRPHRDELRTTLDHERTIVVRDGRIAAIGREIPQDLPIVDAGGRLVTPGLVDAHTHAMFLGDRAAEFCARASGVSYLEIAKAGGGIGATVRPTRAGTPSERLERTKTRLRRLAANGVTTVEVKSGYGLSREAELSMLEELASIGAPDLPQVLPTLMAAHAFPPEFGATPSAEQRASWVRTIAEELVPEVARRRLASRVDVFVEQTAFTHDEARTIAGSARKHGLSLHLHVDQLTANGGAELAAELGAQAVAHLERTTEAGARALAKAGTVAILLPAATVAAREPAPAPAKTLRKEGVTLALATNLNPGTAPTESTSLTLFFASVALGLTPEESLWAFTRGGAKALGIEAGLADPGAPADLVLWNAFEPAHLAYHAAVNHVAAVWRGGRLIAERTSADCDGLL